MPYRISLTPNSESRKARQLETQTVKEEVVEDPVVEEPTVDVFDPEAGKPTDDPFPSDVDYSSMTVAELKALCAERGLAQYGTKAELIERLSQSTEAPVEETAVEEDTATPEEESAVAPESQEEGEVSESEGGTEE